MNIVMKHNNDIYDVSFTSFNVDMSTEKTTHMSLNKESLKSISSSIDYLTKSKIYKIFHVKNHEPIVVLEDGFVEMYEVSTGWKEDYIYFWGGSSDDNMSFSLPKKDAQQLSQHIDMFV